MTTDEYRAWHDRTCTRLRAQYGKRMPGGGTLTAARLSRLFRAIVAEHTEKQERPNALPN